MRGMLCAMAHVIGRVSRFVDADDVVVGAGMAGVLAGVAMVLEPAWALIVGGGLVLAWRAALVVLMLRKRGR